MNAELIAVLSIVNFSLIFWFFYCSPPFDHSVRLPSNNCGDCILVIEFPIPFLFRRGFLHGSRAALVGITTNDRCWSSGFNACLKSVGRLGGRLQSAVAWFVTLTGLLRHRDSVSLQAPWTFFCRSSFGAMDLGYYGTFSPFFVWLMLYIYILIYVTMDSCDARLLKMTSPNWGRSHRISSIDYLVITFFS